MTIKHFSCFTLSKTHYLFNHFVIQTPKPTSGLDALSISSFLVNDDNTIKALQTMSKKGFKFRDISKVA
jgi:hypothetical protein